MSNHNLIYLYLIDLFLLKKLVLYNNKSYVFNNNYILFLFKKQTIYNIISETETIL